MAIGERNINQVLDSLNVESSALDFADKSGISDLALRGPGPELAENIFRARVLAMRPQINSAIAQSSSAPVRALGGSVETGMSERNEMGVHNRVFAQGAEAIQEGARVSGQAQDQAAGAYMGVLSQVDSMEMQAKLQREQIEASQPGIFDRVLQMGSLAASIYSPVG
jgi:hypothetical protein